MCMNDSPNNVFYRLGDGFICPKNSMMEVPPGRLAIIFIPL